MKKDSWNDRSFCVAEWEFVAIRQVKIKKKVNRGLNCIPTH